MTASSRSWYHTLSVWALSTCSYGAISAKVSVCFRAMPPGVFETADWTYVLPHVS